MNVHELIRRLNVINKPETLIAVDYTYRPIGTYRVSDKDKELMLCPVPTTEDGRTIKAWLELLQNLPETQKEFRVIDSTSLEVEEVTIDETGVGDPTIPTALVIVLN